MSHPSQVLLPFPRWEPKEKPVKEDDVGPQVTHIYEVKARQQLRDFPERKWKQRRQGWSFWLLPLLLPVKCKEKRREKEVWKVVKILAAANWGTLPKLRSLENRSSIKASGLRLIKGLRLGSNYPSPAPKQKKEKGGKGEKREEAGEGE